MPKYSVYQTYRNALSNMTHGELIDYTAGLLVQLQKHGIKPDKLNPRQLDFSEVKN